MANGRARSLRKRPTIAERRLWDELKLLRRAGHHFRRQAPIGPYIVDFVCFAQRLVIEIDGVQHDQPTARVADGRRDRDLHWRGFNVVRFQNGDVMEKLDGVLREVWSLIDPVNIATASIDDSALDVPPPLAPPHEGEGDSRALPTVRLIGRSEDARLGIPFTPSGNKIP
jgi:very-short-patch-repair endonuclease